MEISENISEETKIICIKPHCTIVPPFGQKRNYLLVQCRGEKVLFLFWAKVEEDISKRNYHIQTKYMD